ncbi:class I SAM-dependent methyltransferase [Flavobacterium sp. UBA6135]|uniref:class I SAM-dependent methyltransferase n=1 Tax=Flavobacterium sp. UBA6135 TaxID=1946553 RepID=UPI0025C5E232|nr:class I SAM-dependent methyltransferase [Flavobacterium sp. UBA6135]
MDYNNKEVDYYSHVRLDLIGFGVEKSKNQKILEIGAGFGDTLYYLKENGYANQVIGIELYKDSAVLDKYSRVDEMLFGNVEELQTDHFSNNFDVILLPDVLEHLNNPNKVLLKSHKMLTEKGRIVVSMPNVRHYSVFSKIFLKGNFQYEASGIFDYTHVRFYCKKNILELLENNGFKVIKSKGSINSYKGKSIAKIINTITFGILEQFLTPQYFVVAIKK